MKTLPFILVIVVLSAASSLAETGKIYKPDLSNCAGFTASDAGKLLGIPAAAVKAKTEKLSDSLWTCLFSAGDKAVAFSIEVTETAAEAEADMARYRENLEFSAETAPFRNKLPNGAWSEILELGDESTWTDIIGTLTVRKGNVTFQIQGPADKRGQIPVVQALMKKI